MPNSSVKILLEQAKGYGQEIQVLDSYFIVRDCKNISFSFRGIKIRENVWGITFSKSCWPDEKSIDSNLLLTANK